VAVLALAAAVFVKEVPLKGSGTPKTEARSSSDVPAKETVAESV